VLAVIAITGPWALFLFPVAVVLWLARRRVEGAAALAIAYGVAFAIALAALAISRAGAAPIRALPSVPVLVRIAVDTMPGLFAVGSDWRGWATLSLTALGTSCVAICLVQAARRRPPLLEAAVVAGVAILGGGVWRMSLAGRGASLEPWGSG